MLTATNNVRLFAVMLLHATLGQAQAGLPRELGPVGIFEIDEQGLVLFVDSSACDPNVNWRSEGILLSSNRGKSWQVMLTRINGSVFDYVSQPRNGKIWIVGHSFVEGPDHDPFILVPKLTGEGWEKHTIYSGYAELQSVSFLDNGDLVACIRHLRFGATGWSGSLFAHQSSDNGRTWRQIGRASRCPASPSIVFTPIHKNTAHWRVVDKGSTGFEVQENSNDRRGWRTVSNFPDQDCEPY
jgi:hypothetical protein